MSPTALLLERAWLPAPAGSPPGGAFHDDVLVEIEDGRFIRVEPGVRDTSSRFEYFATYSQREDPRISGDPDRVAGLTVPGLANAHSHAFHRALRGRTQRGHGSFWTWREQMYHLAGRLDPDAYLDLATAAYREMALAGITCVGEFHYLHHGPGGTRYADPNETGLVLVEAARRAGIRIALLDTLYLSSGFGAPPEGAQVRYDDGSAPAWAERVASLADVLDPADDAVAGAAVHSVRAVPPEALGAVVEAAEGRPLHVHLSEQVRENDDCLAAHGRTPTRLLADHGVLGPLTTAVHATHLTDDDVALLGGSRTHACFCPTTERDLGDGVGPSRALHAAGSPLTLGSDSHAVVDLFEEMRAVELDERLATRERGHWPAAALLDAGLAHGSLGFPDAGRIEVGARADLVTLDPASVRTAGTGDDEATVVFAATAADVVSTMVGGRVVATRDGRAEAGRALAAAVGRLWS